MPAKPLMRWNKTQRRWEKMYKGGRYFVTCSALNLPESQWTKEESYQTANQWWEKKKAEIDGARAALHPHAERLNELTAQKEYTQRHGHHDEADILDAEITRILQLPTTDPDALPDITPDHGKRLAGFQAIGFDIPPDPLVMRLLSPEDAVQADRLKREARTPQERTMGALVGVWVGNLQDEARKGLRSADGTAAMEVCIGHFRDFIGSAADPNVIDATVWGRWYNRCREMVSRRDAADGKRVKRDDGKLQSWSVDTAKKVFGVSRAFVRWLWTTEVISATPRNLTDKAHKFDAEDREIANFSTAEVQTLLRAATGVHRLILLLSLNAGMYGKDISDLKKVQIDWENGRITRRRSKTRKKKGSPKVSYKLWPETLELLKQHLSPDPEPRAIVTKSGKPWVWTVTLSTGKKRKSDNVATIFNNLKKKVGMSGADKSFKVFRKTSASRLMRSEKYRGLRFLFLSHKPREVADNHYARVGRKALDKAIAALRRSYKLDELDTPKPTTTPTPTL